ncbi:MAG: 2-dehydropantoate 2-reductase [Magnetococcales bacterium]|nr:2-dehydropantoate 2-reductase [Magnetococcales bacterium]
MNQTSCHSPAPPTGKARLRVLVIGTGAVGGYYGAKLAQTECEVAMVCRSDYHEVARHGLQVESIHGDFRVQPSLVLRNARDYPGIPDVVLITVKALPDLDPRELLSCTLGAESVILLLQNGIGVEEPWLQAFPQQPLISGLAFICAQKVGPGRVRHLCYGRLTLGQYPRGRSARLDELVALFQSAGVVCNASEEILRDRWRKLVWNVAFNPISVLGGGLDTRRIMADAALRELAGSLMEEVRILAEAEGFPLPAEVVAVNLAETEKMLPYETSMLLDYRQGRPMEWQAILERPLRQARRRGLTLPRMETLLALLQALENARPAGDQVRSQEKMTSA